MIVDMQPNDGEQQLYSKIFNGAPKAMFPAKNLHHSPKSTQNEEKKTINLRMFLCGLNEKKRLNAQNIQNSIIWYPNKFSCFESGERSLIHLTFQDVFFFYFWFISFTIFQILLFTFTLKPFVYFIHMWERKQPLRGVPWS